MNEKIERVEVILFKPSGKYYVTEDWLIPTEVRDWSERLGSFERTVLGPYDMRHSPDFRRIDGGAVLVPSQEPWGYPCLLPGVGRTEWTGQLEGGPDEGNLVSSDTADFEFRQTTWSWLNGPGGQPVEVTTRGMYRWNEATGTFRWELSR